MEDGNFGSSRKTEQHFQIRWHKMITFWRTVNFQFSLFWTWQLPSAMDCASAWETRISWEHALPREAFCGSWAKSGHPGLTLWLTLWDISIHSRVPSSLTEAFQACTTIQLFLSQVLTPSDTLQCKPCINACFWKLQAVTREQVLAASDIRCPLRS